MRIVGGKLRGLKLEAPVGQDVRPTLDRARETLFNILAHSGWGEGGLSPIHGARVVDVFAGTGALGLEALSRGANSVTFVEQSPKTLVLHVRASKLQSECRVVEADATALPKAKTQHDLVFLDPPFGQGFLPKALSSLVAQGWLKPGALIVAEADVKEQNVFPDQFELLKEKSIGRIAFHFLRYQGM